MLCNLQFAIRDEFSGIGLKSFFVQFPTDGSEQPLDRPTVPTSEFFPKSEGRMGSGTSR